MKPNEIENYLSYEEAMHSEDSKISRVILKDGTTKVVYFLQEHQTEELRSQNKWVLIPIDNLFGYVIQDGDDILSLKVGSKAFV